MGSSQSKAEQDALRTVRLANNTITLIETEMATYDFEWIRLRRHDTEVRKMQSDKWLSGVAAETVKQLQAVMNGIATSHRLRGTDVYSEPSPPRDFVAAEEAYNGYLQSVSPIPKDVWRNVVRGHDDCQHKLQLAMGLKQQAEAQLLVVRTGLL